MKRINMILMGLLILLCVNTDAVYRNYITLEWRYLARGGNTDIYVADINNDSNMEIISGFYNDGFGYVIDKDGKKIWDIQTVVGVEAVYADDIDNDGKIEVMFGAGRPLYITDSNGNQILRFMTQNSIRRISTGDLNNDNLKDIILASQSVRTGEVIVVDNNGNVLWRKTVGGTHTSDFSMNDFNLDGKNEIVIASGKYITMYDGNGDTIWNYHVDGETTDMEISDVDNDGNDDFIVSSTSGIYVLNNKGELIWKFDTNKIEAIKVSDINHDGNVEIVAGGFEKTYLIDNKGKLIWSRNATRQVNDVETGDLDMDGNKEIISGSDTVDVFDIDGNLQWDYKPYMRVSQIRVIDLDSDGKNDLLIGALDNTIYLFKSREIYINEQKSYNLYKNAEELFNKGNYKDALKYIQEAIKISKVYNTGKCKETPSDCNNLLEKIRNLIPSTTTTTTSTTVTTSMAAVTSTSITSPTISKKTEDYGAIPILMLIIIILAAVVYIIYMKKRK